MINPITLTQNIAAVNGSFSLELDRHIIEVSQDSSGKFTFRLYDATQGEEFEIDTAYQPFGTVEGCLGYAMLTLHNYKASK